MAQDATELIYKDGLQLLELGEYEAAIEVFNKITSANPFDFFAYDARGSAYTALKDYEEALNDYSTAIKLNQDFSQSYYNRGRVYSLLERYDEALSDLQESIELKPDEFGYRANGNIGLIYHKQGKYNQAIEAFNTAMIYDDSKADVYYFRGETYTAMENYEAAISDYRAAIDRFSHYDLAYQGLGYAYYKTGQFHEALSALGQALGISPNNPTAHFYLMLVYVATDDVDRAQEEIARGMDAIATLSEEDQQVLYDRILADLETSAQQNPSKTSQLEALLNLIPAGK